MLFLLYISNLSSFYEMLVNFHFHSCLKLTITYSISIIAFSHEWYDHFMFKKRVNCAISVNHMWFNIYILGLYLYNNSWRYSKEMRAFDSKNQIIFKYHEMIILDFSVGNWIVMSKLQLKWVNFIWIRSKFVK